MFMELYKFSKFVMHLNSCSMDLGHDKISVASSPNFVSFTRTKDEKRLSVL